MKAEAGWKGCRDTGLFHVKTCLCHIKNTRKLRFAGACTSILIFPKSHIMAGDVNHQCASRR